MINFNEEFYPYRTMQCLLDVDEEVYPKLSNEDLYMLSLKQFYEKLFKTHYEVQEYTRMISHIAFNNHDISRKIAKKAIVGLNKAQADETFTYISVICAQLILQDKFMTHR